MDRTWYGSPIQIQASLFGLTMQLWDNSEMTFPLRHLNDDTVTGLETILSIDLQNPPTIAHAGSFS
jgi:hypothetical protein